MSDIARALTELVPNGEFRVIDNNIDQITWFEGNADPCPTKEQIETKMSELDAYDAANTHQEKRRPKYPDIGDQLDDLYKQGAFSADMTAKIKAVKDKYPKPS